MGFKYLRDSHWQDITREERYYCAELYFQFRQCPQKLVQLLVDKGLSCFDEKDINVNWELGFEVCFYRDFIKFNSDRFKESERFKKYPRKRTFDLCLFSDKKIVIIEAKVQQRLESNQNTGFEKDIKLLSELFDESGLTEHPKIEMIALLSSVYLKNVEKYGKGLTKLFANKYISWDDIFIFSKNSVFDKANKLYKK